MVCLFSAVIFEDDGYAPAQKPNDDDTIYRDEYAVCECTCMFLLVYYDGLLLYRSTCLLTGQGKYTKLRSEIHFTLVALQILSLKPYNN